MSALRVLRRRRQKQLSSRERRRPSLLEVLEPRLLLSADNAITGVTAALGTGFDAVYNGLSDLIASDAVFENYVPGILTTQTSGDSTVTVSPTLRDAIEIDVDVYSPSDPTGGSGDLGARFNFIEGLDWIFASDYEDEKALRTMDLDTNGMVGVDEAFSVLVLGQIQNYLDTTDIGEFWDGYAGVSSEDFRLQLNWFLNLGFGLPAFLSDRFDLALTASSASPGSDVLFDLDVSLTLKQNDQVDLGSEADALHISFDSGTTSTEVLVNRTIDFGSFVFGFNGASDESVSSDDFYFAVPEADGMRIGVNIGSPGSPASVAGMEVNVGFLGTTVQGVSGDGYMLDMDVIGFADDPSNPDALGFTTQPVTGSGSITADAEPESITENSDPGDDYKLANNVVFTLQVGTEDYSPTVEITVPASWTTTNTSLADLIDDVWDAIDDADPALASLITVDDDGGKIRLTLPTVDPSQLGFNSEHSGVNTITSDFDSPQIGRTSSFPWETETFDFLLSVAGQTPKLVTVNTFPASPVSPGPDGSWFTGDDLWILTKANLISQVQTALNTAFGPGVVTAGDGGGNKISLSATGTLEITSTLTLDTVEEITLAELGTGQVLEVEPDSAASFTVDLTLKADAGLHQTGTSADYRPEGTISVDIGPFDQGLLSDGHDLEVIFLEGDPDTGVPVPRARYALAFGGDMDPAADPSMLYFNLVTAENMIGLLAGLGLALQNLGSSGVFANYDSPFADASFSDLFNFRELIATCLLFDDGGDGFDGATDYDKLLEKFTSGDETYLLPTFETAQDLAVKLSEVLGVALTGAGGINAEYDPATDELTYSVVLFSNDRVSAGVQIPLEVPFEFDVDLSPFAKLTVDETGDPGSADVSLQGRTVLSTTFGINLEPPGKVIYEDTPLEDLNGGDGIDIKTKYAVTGADRVRTLYVLSDDAHFALKIDGGAPIVVVIDAEDTQTNTSIGELITDISFALTDALAGTGYEGQVAAGYDVDNPSRLKLYATGGATTIQLLAYSNDPTVAELGFPGYSDPASSVTAHQEPRTIVGRLTDDATFTVSVSGGATGDVTVAASATAGNNSIADLVADVNNALVAAGLGDDIVAGFDVSTAHGARLVLSAKDPGAVFTVDNCNPFAQSQLGLTDFPVTADQADIVIVDRDGMPYPIVLDSLNPETDTVADLIALIDGQTGGAVTAELNSTHNGLRLIDHTGGTGRFRVETINGTGVALQLGLIGTGSSGDPDIIEGGSIGLTNLDDRFFVENTEIVQSLKLETPPAGVYGDGLFGLVGVDVNFSGSLFAELSAELKDPETTAVGGQVTLAELFEGAVQGRLTADASFTVEVNYEGPSSVSVPVIVPKAMTENNNSIDDLVDDVNEVLEGTILDGQIIAQPGTGRLIFAAVDDTITSFTITASGTGATELGLRATQTSEDVDEVPTLAARTAARYAVAEPTVAKLSELDYEQGIFDDDFTRGAVLVGQTSGATAVILDIEPFFDTGTLTLFHLNGTFQNGEDIEDSLGGEAEAVGSSVEQEHFGEFILDVTVQEGFNEYGFGDALKALHLLNFDVPVRLTAFGNPYDPAPPEASLEASAYAALAPFEHLDYSHLYSALEGFYNPLEGLQGVLEDVEASFTLLNEPIPGIGKSVSDLLSLVDGFARGVDNAGEVFDEAALALEDVVDMPALRLQDIPRALRGAFGLPDGVNPDVSGAVDWVRLDFDDANNMLMVDMSLNETISTKLGLDIDLSGQGLPNLTSGGVLIVEGSLDVNLSFGIDLDTPEDAYLFDTSNIAGSLDIVGEGQQYAGGEDGMGLVFRASLGALTIFIQDGDALVDVAFELPGLDFGGPYRKLIRDVVYADWLPPVTSPDEVAIVLPMFYGGEGPNDYVDDFEAFGSLDGGLTVTVPDFSDILTAIEEGDLAYDPFDNILLAVETLNLYLEGLSDTLAGDVLGISMPFIGDQMADILFIEGFRGPLYSTLKNGIANAINPDPDTIVQSLLASALGGYLVGGIGGITYFKDVTSEDVRDWYRQWNFTLAGSKTIMLSDFDLGISNLGFDVDVPVQVVLEWELGLGFGVNFAEVAYIDVSDVNELDLDLTITLPEDGTGRLGFLKLDVTDPGNDTGAVLNFDVDVENGNTGGDHLGFSDLGSITPVAKVQGSPLTTAADGNEDGNPDAVTLHLVTTADKGLPSMWTDLVIDWSLFSGDINDPGVLVSSLSGDAVTPGIESIGLYDMWLDAGSVAEWLLDPLFGRIAEFIEPFMPVVDTLTYPIPILSDLAGEPFTLLDLAAIFGSVDPAFIGAVADILDVISKINEFKNAPPLPLGDLVLYDPDDGIPENFIPNDPTSDLADIDVVLTVMGDPTTTPGWTFDEGAYNAAIDGNDFLKDVRDGNLADGLTMPILTDPRQGVMLFLDQNAVMVDYLLPPLSVEFEYLQVFPIWGPLAVSIEISFGFTVDLHSVGFDTYGYERYADGGFRNAALILDGFYLNDLDEEGVDAPEVLFEFGLVGAAELNLVIARAGVGGGIDARVFFDWHDAIPDGRVHISEMLGSMWANDGNPLAVFDVGGALTFQMFAFLEISLFGIEEEFPITPETELFSFEIPFDRPPVLATRTEDGTLILNMGPNAEDRLHGDTSDGHEALSLECSGSTVYVWSDALGVKYGDKQEYSGIGRIVGIGGQGNDTIEISGSDIPYILEGGVGDDIITVTGGTGGGVIRGGVGNDTLTGGDGNDIIYGEEGNDVISGSGGYDILFGDQGRVFDFPTDPDPLVTSRITGSDGDDEIYGGADDDIIIGAGGDDILNGDAGDDVIIGDGGRFAYLNTPGPDAHFDITSVRPAGVYPYVPEEVDTDNPTDPDTISEDIDKIYDAVVGIFHATDLGFGGNDTISGGANDDIILSGSGDDIVDGDGGADIILGGKGFDNVHGGADNDTIFGGDQADTIAGDGEDDVISGGSGNDYIHGNTGDDVMKGDSGADVMFGDAGDDQVFGQTEPDILFGGADDDLVVGGTSNDIMFGDDGVVAKLNPDYVPGSDPDSGIKDKVIFNDTLISMSVVDSLLASVQTEEGDSWWDNDVRSLDLIQTYVVAGDGDDFLSGNAGDDFMFGGGGNDTMGGDVDPRLPTFLRPTEISEDVMIGDGGRITFDQRRFRSIATVIGDTTGSPFDDTIYGDNGNDYILGGRGNDTLAGGHGPDRGATDAEASDNDVIIGDNGALLFADEFLGDTTEEREANFGRLTLIRTTDIANDTGGADTAYGEEGADVILGGVNGATTSNPDKLYGDYYDYTGPVPTLITANDIILGDNGLLDFALGSDTNLDTLDLIHSEPYAVTDWSTDPPTLDDTTILGGVDIIDGSVGYDVLIGGVAGDTMYGDDETASNAANDGEDIMLGDNGDIFLIGSEGRLLVQVTDMIAGTAVDFITTTDIEDETGGADTMSGNAKADIMLGGVNDGGEDVMYGDRGGPDPEDQPTPASILNDGDDILLGDNGLLDFTFDGDESGLDRQTLDLIRSSEDALGGTDVISGNKGLDVAIGGTGGDEIYGDDANASAAADDLGDLLLGDNADIFLVPKGTDTGADLKLVLPLNLATDAAVKTIRTTDTVDPDNTGGSDTISGNAAADIIAGGVYGDIIYGDREVPNATTEGNEGDDIILGDNGAFEWLSTGRLGEITGIDIYENNPELYDWFTTTMSPDGDDNLGTLDLVTTEQPTSGGRDLIYGDQGRDLVFAGTDADTIYGDDGNETGDAGNDDLLLGDHGRIYPQFPRFKLLDGTFIPADFQSRNFFAIDTGDANGGEGDRMWGEEGDDTMLGQQGDDRMWGGGDDDDMTGGHNVSGGYDELTAPAIDASLDAAIPVPAIDDVNDLMDGGTGDDSMAGDNAIIWRRGDDLSPRFRELTEDAIYTTTADSIIANIGEDWQSDPADAVGRDIELVDHSDAVQADPQGRFGADVMAGGADSDVMFGELANDLMQGDGSIETSAVDVPFLSYELDVDDSGYVPPDPDTSETLYFNIPEAATDADDYMEGSGGDDLMYGGLGQDDMIGGSSELFGLTAEEMRPDGSDVIFGGAATAIARNDIGATETEELASEDADHVITTAPDGHARDADFIMGDNANVYRLVEGGASGTDPDDVLDEFLTFNYDDVYGLQIIPRAMEQLDYQLGGADYNGGEYINGAADPDGAGGEPADNGAADLIHGESGDDIIFGMTGSDLIFGEGQDDDIIGGYGHDWISGGTGQDGVLGDDGLISTSRNSADYGEPLYRIDALLDKDPRPKYADGNVLNEVIKTPGEIQYAMINLADQLKKTADLVPFSFDPTWIAMDDEFPDDDTTTPYADDIIFGGLGTDWLHGGSGDDAISGAEALEHAYVPTYDDVTGEPDGVLDLGYEAVALPSPTNPGDVLAFNPVDLDGQHLNNRFRAGEFALYDEYDPRRAILLNADGTLNKDGAGVEFLLNFEETEGVVRPEGEVAKATGQQTENYPAVNDDGKDSIFGDLGNDWLVGGTGRDNIYGGWGNDLLNADDDHDGHDDANNLNEEPDTHPYYEDRAYGGAGRDVLIGNTGGDRLIDWVGEYNSYLVPYAPFGQASVSRTLQPFLPEFLYALSAGDGADPTRPDDTGADPLRNGEPDAEMGLVLQMDFAWQDQTGAPADPQAGNIPGGKRDVLRTASFNLDETQGFAADVGTWEVKSGRYYVEPEVLGGDALSVWHHDQTLPSYFELTATVSLVKPIAGYKANAYIVFDYYSDEDFKFAGLNSSTNKIEIGRRTADGWEVLVSSNMLIKYGKDYNLLLALNGTTATIVVNNGDSLSYSFAPRIDVYGLPHNLNEGMVGLGANNAKASIDNVNLQVIPPQITLTATDEFDTGPELVVGETGTWTLSGGYLVGEPEDGQTLALAVGELTVGPAYLLQLETTFSTETTAGVVFDQYDIDDFKWAAYSKTTSQVMIGHYTARDGWVTDNAISYGIEGEATLKVVLKGSTVSVMINDDPAVSHVFNAVVTDGRFGLIAKDGSASFDAFTVRTDDPSFAAEAETHDLTAAAAPVAQLGETITDAALAPIVAEAIDRWENVLGVDGTLLAALYDMNYQVVDLDGLVLGQALPDTILVDADAAGYGWFVDPTPSDDAEFTVPEGNGELFADSASDAFGCMDLLTVVMHELGHTLGFEDLTSETSASDVMSGTLPDGVRRTGTHVLDAQTMPGAAGWARIGVKQSVFEDWISDWWRRYGLPV